MTVSSRTQPAKLVYFPHIEGLRGVAAFYVLLFHLTQSATRIGASFHNAAVVLPLLYGHYAVAVFIVISGFVLGLPVARSRLNFDARKFADRRFRRIYPAYVLALLLTLPTFFFYAANVYGKHPSANHVLIGLFAHIFLVQNFAKSTLEYSNPPMWSVALETQIYVIFALILVPIWRRFGLTMLLLTALGLGLLPHFLLHGYLDWSYPWFLGLFGFGVYAAAMVSRGSLLRIPWKVLCVASCLLTAALLLWYPDATDESHPWRSFGPDLAVGMSSALFIVASCTDGEDWLPRRFLAWWPIEKLGSISYSLYLVHIIVVETIAAFLVITHGSAIVWAVASLAAIPVSLAFAYGFYLIAERPFLSSSYRAAVDRAFLPSVPFSSFGSSEIIDASATII